MDAYATANWASLTVAVLGAAAALMGLIFISISINLRQMFEQSTLTGRAIEALGILFAAVVTSVFVLTPGQPINLLGVELLVLGVSVWYGGALLQWRSRKVMTGDLRGVYIVRIVCWQGGALPIIFAGVSLLAGHGGGLYWLVPADVFAFLISVLDAWVLLVEIVRPK